MHNGLKAVIFDVDGTLVDSERDGHRIAFNQAFGEAGLPDRWDVERYGELLEITGGQRRIDAHLAQRGMAAEEREPLSRRLHVRKTEIFIDLAKRGAIEPRAGVSQLMQELHDAGVRLAVATTGGAEWVHPLLERLFGADRFEVIVTRREAPDLKPDPSAHQLTLERLSLPAEAVVAVEDSRNGLVAAKGAGLPCAIVINDYTRAQDFGEADLVLDSFGGADGTSALLADPHGVEPPGRLDVGTFHRLVALGATA